LLAVPFLRLVPVHVATILADGLTPSPDEREILRRSLLFDLCH